MVRVTASLATQAAWAVLLGGMLAAGLCLIVAPLPSWSAPRLQRRIHPYVRDITDPAGLTPLTAGIWSPSDPLRRLVARAASSENTMRQLRQAGRAADADAVVAFRWRQLIWAAAGLTAGGMLTVALALAGRFTLATVALPPAVAGVFADGYGALLTRSAARRVHHVQEELPTVLEFLSLCLSAGEGVLDAVRRVASTGAGELTFELRAVVLAVGTGSTLGEALTSMAGRLQIPSLTRAVDHVVAALDRGAPLAAVLQAQAHDAREDAKRHLIEAAGRKEIVMLLPLVFLILPLSVLFAVLSRC